MPKLKGNGSNSISMLKKITTYLTDFCLKHLPVTEQSLLFVLAYFRVLNKEVHAVRTELSLAFITIKIRPAFRILYTSKTVHLDHHICIN